MEHINILYQFNDIYAAFAGVSITSLLENNRDADIISIYILGEELSQTTIQRFKSLCKKYSNIQLIFPDVRDKIHRLKELDLPAYRGSYAANLRMFLDEFVDVKVDRILYLDADTIVDHSLQDLFDYNLSGNTLGMVLESLENKWHKVQIGLEKDSEYFNSGMILYDMHQWRKKGYADRIMEHIKNIRSHYSCPDQDLINIICKGDIFRLPLNYNYQPFHRVYPVKLYRKVFQPFPYYSDLEINAGNNKPVIYHCYRYIGEFPWHKNTLHPFVEEFDKYLAISPWNDYEKKSPICSLTVQIEKWLNYILPKSIFLPIFKLAHNTFMHQSEKKSRRKN